MFWLTILITVLFSSSSLAGDCLSCHEGIETIDKTHNFSCESCHVLPDKEASKHEVIENPSDPKYVSTFCGKCHQREIKEVKNSLHSTCSGIINQTRYLFGAQTLSPLYSANEALKKIPESSEKPSSNKEIVDDFLRRACLKCHINVKGEKGRGLYHSTGCCACHMETDNDGIYKGKDSTMLGKVGYPKYHRFMKHPSDKSCLHCHNKRAVGTDYYGMYPHDYSHEYRSPVGEEKIYGIDFHHLTSDIHQKLGLSCVDCHRREIMKNNKDTMDELTAVGISCEDCHGGYNKKPNKKYVKIINKKYIYTSVKGKRYTLHLFNKDIVPHYAFHKDVSCSACHSAWNYGDYGFYIFRDDTDNYTMWKNLFTSGDPEIETFLKNAWENQKKGIKVKPMSKDYISGRMEKGIWHHGFMFRRWEWGILVKHNGKYLIGRPFQYVVTYKDENKKVIINNENTKWTTMPYIPHTTTLKGRDCLSCHLNSVASGNGLWKEGKEMKLLIPSKPLFNYNRLLTKQEKQKLLNKEEFGKYYLLYKFKF